MANLRFLVFPATGHQHLPELEEVEQLALLLVQLSDAGDHHLVPVGLMQQITPAAADSRTTQGPRQICQKFR